MNEVRIPYKPNKILFLLVIVFFGACTAVIGNIAITNDRGLVLFRILEFSVQEASIFFWVITVIALAFVLVGVAALIKSFTSKREIIISDTFITSPKSGFSKLDITVKFSDVTNVTMQTVEKTKILNIDYIDGRLSIPNSMLPNKQAFEELVSHIQVKLNG